MKKLDEYRPIVGRNIIRELRFLGERLQGKSVLNINSTRIGGGVAEILINLVPLLNQVGVEARWDVISGDPAFFDVTKKIHNALHGRPETITEDDYQLFHRGQPAQHGEDGPGAVILYSSTIPSLSC